MKVRAKSGTQCPKETEPRNYITDAVAVYVPETAYYLRLIADGSLVVLPDANAAKDKEVKYGQ